MDALDFLDQARELEKSTKEVDWRTALCSVYYFAYHDTQWLADSLSDHSGMASARGSHQVHSFKLKNYPTDEPPDDLDSETIKVIRMIGYKLIALHASRVRAHYKLGAPVRQEDVTQALIEAERFRDRVEQVREKFSESYPELLQAKAG